jgi:hypothetical protein
MNTRRIVLAATAVAAASIAMAVAGCGKKAGLHTIIPNLRPTVELTSAPVDKRDTTFYAYRLNWSGNDADGRVDHFEYSIDPPRDLGADTTWTRIAKNELIVFFPSRIPITGGKPGEPIRSVDFHTFVIRAVDNLGAISQVKDRSFTSYTVAPSVSVIAPPASPVLRQKVTPSVRLAWQGTDPDGQFTQKPVKYKYKLLGRSNSDQLDIDDMFSHPDKLRDFYAKNNFASWDSVGGDTTGVQFTNLTPGSDYLFVVIGYDEAGAYSANFSQVGNMVRLSVDYATTLGPTITAFNQFFFYSMPSGGFVPNNPLSWVNLEVPADQILTFNWFGAAPSGANIDWYRWKLDGNVQDETQRSNEATDWYHWSTPGVGTTQCVIGKFVGGEAHKLYIECQDNTGLLSVLVINFIAVAPTWEKDLLIVDDTRPEVDQFVNGRQLTYTQSWPATAEMDTFLYARGGVPWRSVRDTTRTYTTYPGIFAGYQFDTLGSRQGFEIASAGVPLSKLGKYTHIIWMVDSKGGHNTNSGVDPIAPTGVLRFMNTPGNPNTLSTYSFQGGRLWLLGSNAAYASLIKFNATRQNDNDNIYGPYVTVFSSDKGELAPGRIMYDGAHWQSEMVFHSTYTQIARSASTPTRPWSQPGWKFVNPRTNPDYTKLPARMRAKALAIGDSLPPTRNANQSGQFYSTAGFDAEYLSQPNRILEDINPAPDTVTQASTLDTLMKFQGGTLVTTNGATATHLEAVCMTYYHGVQSPEFVFSGFNIWSWARQDCISLVDFVLQEIWHMQRSPVNRNAQFGAQSARALASSQKPITAVRSTQARLPVARPGAGR